MHNSSGNPDESSNFEDPELARIRRLLRQFDSLETRLEQSEFLDAIGKTRPVIDSYRRYVARADRQAAAQKAAPKKGDAPVGRGPEHRLRRRIRRRSPGRRPLPVNGPPGRDDRRRRRNRTPKDGPLYLIVIIRLR
jgi:hypothetical protein